MENVRQLESSTSTILWLVTFYNGVQYLFRGTRLYGYMWKRLEVSELNWNTFERIED